MAHLKSFPVSGLSIEQLSSDLAEYLIPGQTIYGATLGTILISQIRKQGLTIDLRSIGGLRKFVSTNLESLLRIHGEDDTYTVLGSDEPITGWSVVDGTTRLFWDLFNNPNQKGRFAYFDDGKLLANSAGSDIPQTAKQISALLHSDYADIATEYAKSAPENWQETLDSALKSRDDPKFFHEWIDALRLVDPTAVRAWEEYRVDHVVELLKTQLKESGADDSIAGRYAADLLASQKRARTSRSTKAEIGQVALVPVISSATRTDFTNGNLRNILEFAAHHMSEEEIRRISIPIGVCIDALLESG